MRNLLILNACILLAVLTCAVAFSPSTLLAAHVPLCRKNSALSMGILDSISSFIKKREGDFVRLEDSGSAGPGPLMLLYNLPPTIQIEHDEYRDMCEDGAPKAFKNGVIIAQITRNDGDLLDMSLSNALEKIVQDNGVSSSATQAGGDHSGGSIIFFSGFDNQEMMDTYNIVGKEIYEESGGSVSPACAKAVPNAMEKPMRQVLEEIAGDHEEAQSMSTES